MSLSNTHVNLKKEIFLTNQRWTQTRTLTETSVFIPESTPNHPDWSITLTNIGAPPSLSQPQLYWEAVISCGPTNGTRVNGV